MAADNGWNAYMASLGFQGQTAQQINANRHKQIGAEYEFEKGVAEEAGRRGARDINVGQEDRGMLRSGDTMRRQGEHAYDTQVALGRLGLSAANRYLDADSTLASQMAGYQISQASAQYQHNQQLQAEAEQEAWQAEQEAQAEADAQAILDWMAANTPHPGGGSPAEQWEWNMNQSWAE